MRPAGRRSLRRGAGDRKKKDGPGHDGWLAAWYHYAAAEYGWSHEEIMWKVPLSVIALMMRRPLLAEKRIFPLTEIEKIDDGNEKAQSGT